MKNHIGEEIRFSTFDFETSKNAFKTHVIPALDKFKDAYTKLGIGDFTQDIYEIACSKGVENLREPYERIITEELSKMGVSAIREISLAAAREHFLGVRRAWENVEHIRNIIRLGVTGVEIHYSFLSYDLKSGKWMIQEEDLKKRFSKIIMTEDQSMAYEHLLQLKQLHSRTKKVFTKAPNFRHSIFANIFTIDAASDSSHVLIYEDEKGEAQIDVEAFSYIFKL
jgi:hypothetical protein